MNVPVKGTYISYRAGVPGGGTGGGVQELVHPMEVLGTGRLRFI